MIRRKRTTDWPEGYVANIRGRRFTGLEELLLWDRAVMCECFEEVLAIRKEWEGWLRPTKMRFNE
jgi:hypothetical protein